MKRNAKRLLALLLVLTLCVGLFPGLAFAEGEEITEDPAPVGVGVLDDPDEGAEGDPAPMGAPAPAEEPEDPAPTEAGEDEPLQPAEPAAPPEGEPEDEPDALPDEAEPNDEPASNACGDNLTWALDDAGTLTISGTGDMWNYYWAQYPAPWYDQRDSIRVVEIRPGVTSIGDGAFSQCRSLTDIAIPGGVTSIGNGAFSQCRSLTDIAIPEGVTKIGYQAFSECDSLTSITIPASVTGIGNAAFSSCRSLADIYYGGTVSEWNAFGEVHDYYLTTVHCSDGEILTTERNRCGDNLTWALDENGTLTISGTGDMWDYPDGSYAPWDDQRDSIRAVEIRQGVTSIGDSAFSYYRSLTDVAIPEDVTSIGSAAFAGCSSLTNVTIPGSVTSIEYAAFFNCSSLTALNFGGTKAAWLELNNWWYAVDPYSVTVHCADGDLFFDRSACGNNLTWTLDDSGTLTVSGTGDMWDFEGNTPWYEQRGSIRSVVLEPGVTGIAYAAFSNCTSLTSVTIPEGVASIRRNAFYGCSALTSVTLPAGLPGIEDGAFSWCSSLTSITIPEGVSYIGNNAFSYCSSLKEIIFTGQAVYFSPDTFEGDTLTAYYPYGDPTWSEYVRQNYGGTVTWVPRLAAGVKINENGTIEVDSFEALEAALVYIREEGLAGDDQFTQISYRGTEELCIERDLEIPAGVYLRPFYSGVNLRVPAGVTLTNRGVIDFTNGDIVVEGSLRHCAARGTVWAANYRISGELLLEGQLYINGGTIEGFDKLRRSGTGAYIQKNVSFWESATAAELIAAAADRSDYAWADRIMVVANGSNSSELLRLTQDLTVGAKTTLMLYRPVKIPGSFSLTVDGSVVVNAEMTVEGTLINNGSIELGGGEGYPQPGVISLSGGLYEGSGTITGRQDKAAQLPGFNLAIFEELPSYGTIWRIRLRSDVAHYGTCGENLFWLLDKDWTLTITGTGDMPDFLNSSQSPWGFYNYGIKKIVIAEGVTSVGDYAFISNEVLKTVQLPDSVRRIGKHAFEECTVLPTVDLSHVEIVDQYAFTNCPKLVSVTLAEHMQTIGFSAFSDCASLKTVTMPKTLEEMNWDVFRLCTKLEKISFPTGVDTVPIDFCFGCTALTSVTLPEGVRVIDSGAFESCQALKKITLPQSLEEIGNQTFAWSGLTSVSIPENVRLMGSGAFCGCKSLASVSFSTGLRKLEDRVFMESGLKTAALPEGLESLGFETFLDCTKLTTVSFPSTLSEIPMGTCSGCSYLTSVTIAEGPTVFGFKAFADCVRLPKLQIPASVRTLGNKIFTGDKALKEFRFAGDAPQFTADTFAGLTASAYYIKSTEGWTPEVLQNYGGEISWIPTYPDGKIIKVTAAQILDEAGETVTGKTLDFDLNGERSELRLFAGMLPEEASQSVKWTVSDTRHTYCAWTVNDDGSLTLTPSGTGKTGSVTVTATAQDGSKKAAKVTVKLVRLAHEINIAGEDSRVIYGGGKLTFKTDIAADKTLTDKRVTWSVDDKTFASVNTSGVLSTKAVTEPTTVTVTATVTATGASDSVTVTIYPKVTALSFDGDTEIVKNAASFDLYSSRASVTFTASATPNNAYQGVAWTVSDTKHTYCDWTVNDDGSITLVPSGTGKTGSVTITATAQDGTKKAAKLTLKFGKFAQSLRIAEGYPTELRAGAKISFKTDIAADKTLTDKRVTWTIDDTTFATVNASGVLTAKKTVTEPVTVTVTAAATANPAAADTAAVTIYPAATAAQILRGETALAKGEIVDLNLDGVPSVQLTGATLPANAIQRGTWKSSAPKVATVDETGLVTGLKAGTATVTFTAADGSGKNTTVKIRVGKWTERITLGEHAESLVSGKTMTVKAAPLTTDGLTPTVKALSWTSSDPTAATVSAGKVTAKTVYRITEVTITAAATDGSGVSASFTVQIVPKTAEGLLLMQGAALVNGKTLTVSLAEAQGLDLEALLYTTATDSTAPAAGTWKSSATGMARVDANGHVTLLKAGTAKITVTQGKLIATVTIKVTK